MTQLDTGSKVAAPPRGLGREFNLLWAGQSVSNVGDRVTLFVVPTVLIFLLGASAFQVGLVSMAQYLAIPILSLVAGGLVDRMEIRSLLIGCDLVRLVAIGLIPLAWWLGFLSIPLLFGCVVAVSAATVFFNIGYVPMISAIVPASELVRGNSRLETSRTVAELGGPALAGLAYHLLGVVALVVDAASYLVSAVCLRSMRTRTPRVSGVRLWSRLGVGVRRNWQDPVLRRCTAGTLLANIGGPIFVTQLPVLAYQGLGLSAATLGAVMSIAAVGAVVGALVASRVDVWLGTGRMQGLAMVLHSLSGLGILATLWLPAAPVLAVTLGLYGLFFAWYNICSQSIRQRHMPTEDQAVIVGAYRTVTWGVIPISVFVGGCLVTALDVRLDLLHAALSAMAAATLIGVSAWVPLSRLQPLLDAEKVSA